MIICNITIEQVGVEEGERERQEGILYHLDTKSIPTE